jgi:hypothetical protein
MVRGDETVSSVASLLLHVDGQGGGRGGVRAR